MTTGLEGGCLCGAIRYELLSTPFEAGYCHCTLCRRASGAPVLAFATVPLNDFSLLSETPGKRKSSWFGERWFCRNCGTQLCMHVRHQPATIDFTLGSLDAPSRIHPTFHIFYGSRVPWFECADLLPRYEEFRPDTPGLVDGSAGIDQDKRNSM